MYNSFRGVNFCSVRVIVQQVATLATYYFIKEEVAYRGNTNPSILDILDGALALYLYEPGSATVGPMYEHFRGPIIVICSPDSRRYKEFRKQNTMLFYIPVWSLAELRSVGEYIEYDSNLIEEYYERFGGVFRYIFQNSYIYI